MQLNRACIHCSLISALLPQYYRIVYHTISLGLEITLHLYEQIALKQAIMIDTQFFETHSPQYQLRFQSQIPQAYLVLLTRENQQHSLHFL